MPETPMIGDLMLWPGQPNLAGWALCDGRRLPTSAHPSLFESIGSTYGGDEESFAVARPARTDGARSLPSRLARGPRVAPSPLHWTVGSDTVAHPLVARGPDNRQHPLLLE